MMAMIQRALQKHLLTVLTVSMLITPTLSHAEGVPTYQQVAIPSVTLPAGTQVTVNSNDISNPTFLQMLANLGKYIMNAFIPAKTTSNEKIYIPKDSFKAPVFTGEQVVELKEPTQVYKAEARVTKEAPHSEELTKMELSDAIQKDPSGKKEDCVTSNKPNSETGKNSGWDQFVSKFEKVAKSSDVNQKAVAKTLNFMKTLPPAKQAQIKNRRYVTISDMSMRSQDKRMAVLDLETGKVSHYLVAHGEGGGEGDRLTSCSSKANSKQTPPGFLVVNAPYSGSYYGRAIKMQGLESRNSNSFARAIVMHPRKNKMDFTADEVIKGLGRFDLSQGCPMLTESSYAELESKLKGGSLYYNFCPQDW
jgi:hypothetical protein